MVLQRHRDAPSPFAAPTVEASGQRPTPRLRVRRQWCRTFATASPRLRRSSRPRAWSPARWARSSAPGACTIVRQEPRQAPVCVWHSSGSGYGRAHHQGQARRPEGAPAEPSKTMPVPDVGTSSIRPKKLGAASLAVRDVTEITPPATRQDRETGSAGGRTGARRPECDLARRSRPRSRQTVDPRALQPEPIKMTMVPDVRGTPSIPPARSWAPRASRREMSPRLRRPRRGQIVKQIRRGARVLPKTGVRLCSRCRTAARQQAEAGASPRQTSAPPPSRP
jgi:hypothetical protein